MADPNTVGRQFVDYYYQTFDSNRANLAQLYRDPSMLTFEGQATAGGKAIVDKLVSLPFQQVRHVVSTSDAQPGPNGSILVTVTGQLLIDQETQPQFFSQTFHLIPEGGSFFVYNDIFRLVLGM